MEDRERAFIEETFMSEMEYLEEQATQLHDRIANTKKENDNDWLDYFQIIGSVHTITRLHYVSIMSEEVRQDFRERERRLDEIMGETFLKLLDRMK